MVIARKRIHRAPRIPKATVAAIREKAKKGATFTELVALLPETHKESKTRPRRLVLKAIDRILRLAGIPVVSSIPRKSDPDLRKRVVAMVEKGLTRADIARHLGLNYGFVRTICKEECGPAQGARPTIRRLKSKYALERLVQEELLAKRISHKETTK